MFCNRCLNDHLQVEDCDGRITCPACYTKEDGKVTFSRVKMQPIKGGIVSIFYCNVCGNKFDSLGMPV